MDNSQRKNSEATPRQDDDESTAVLTPRELSKMLHVSVQLLYLWRKRGRGPPFIRESVKSVVYRPASVARWLREQEVTIQKTYTRKKKPPGRPKRTTRADKVPQSESPGA